MESPTDLCLRREQSGAKGGEYSFTQSGSDFLVTYNNGGTLHDIVVKGADPTGDVFFF